MSTTVLSRRQDGFSVRSIGVEEYPIAGKQVVVDVYEGDGCSSAYLSKDDAIALATAILQAAAKVE
jgi:hypothetical protein